MLFNERKIREWLGSKHTVSWGTSFSLTSKDSFEEAVKWFMNELNELHKFETYAHPDKKITLKTPSGSFIMDGVRIKDLIFDDNKHHFRVVGWGMIELYPADLDLETKDDILTYLAINDTLEILKL